MITQTFIVLLGLAMQNNSGVTDHNSETDNIIVIFTQDNIYPCPGPVVPTNSIFKMHKLQLNVYFPRL